MDKKFIFTTALYKIRLMNKRIKVIPGGSSAGKTFSILPILIDTAIKREGILISVVSESLPHLRRGAMRDFLNIMKMTGRYIDNHWNRTNSIYEFSNGSQIEFFSVDDDSKLRGARRNILYINECNNVSEEAYTQLAMRTSEDIYLDYNPTGHFWADELIGDDIERLVLTYKDNEATPESSIKFFEDRIQKAKTSEYWNNWVNVYVNGLSGSLQGTVFNNWTITDSIPEEAKLIGNGLDFGYTNDPTACVSVYKIDNRLIFDEIIYNKGLSNSDLANIMKQNSLTGETICDSAEPKTIDELKKYGLKVHPTVKGPDSILYGIQILQEYEISITRRSINLKKELENYTWKKDRDGNSLNIPIDAYNHAIDAIRYLAMMKLGKKRISVIDEGSYKITSSRIPMGY